MLHLVHNRDPASILGFTGVVLKYMYVNVNIIAKLLPRFPKEAADWSKVRCHISCNQTKQTC